MSLSSLFRATELRQSWGDESESDADRRPEHPQLGQNFVDALRRSPRPRPATDVDRQDGGGVPRQGEATPPLADRTCRIPVVHRPLTKRGEACYFIGR